ncbi:MAG: methylated-DNA--[protein]-cysteine S-methyltransferase [Desulfomonilia bacterium]
MKQGSCHEAEHLCVQISRFLTGEEIVFPLDTLMFETCTTFQRDVLLAEYHIPRGWVSTYGKIARHLGQGGPRAVGTALARNPFPVVIPCHRAVRSDGTLGGFQGGVAMKRALLEYEGIPFSPENRVKTEKVYY